MNNAYLFVPSLLTPLMKRGLLNNTVYSLATNQASRAFPKKMEGSTPKHPSSGKTMLHRPLAPRAEPSIMPVTMKQIKDAITATADGDLVINHTIITTIGSSICVMSQELFSHGSFPTAHPG